MAPGRGGGRARRGGRARAGAARRAGRRRAAASPAAAAFLQRAVALTGDPARRAGRALAAAEASLGAGAFDVARGLLAAAEAGPLDELGRARVDLLRAEVAFAQNRGGDAPLLLLAGGAEARAARRPPRARHLPRRVGARRCSPAAWRPRAAACSTSPAPRRPRPLRPARRSPATCCSTASRWSSPTGRPAAAPVLRRAVAAFAGAEVVRRGGAPLGLAGVAGGRTSSGTTTAASRSPRAAVRARPRVPGRSRSSPPRTTRAARPPRSAATSRAPRCRSRRSTPSRRRPGRRIAPYAGDRARRASAADEPRPAG